MKITPYIRKANYYETDQMGIIHHSNYIRWMEEARTDFLDKLNFGYHRVEELGIAFAVIGISCEYKAMVRFGDTVEIQCNITHCHGVRMSIAYQIVDATTKEVRTTGESRHCFLNRKNRPTQLRKVIPELYETFVALSKEEH